MSPTRIDRRLFIMFMIRRSLRYPYLAIVLWILGYPEQAQQHEPRGV